MEKIAEVVCKLLLIEIIEQDCPKKDGTQESAGTYSVLQPDIAHQLRDRKLGNLGDMKLELIASANIGCITHLQSGTETPVRHWVKLLDEALN